MGRLKAIAYDVDGTLLDSVNAGMHVLQETFQKGAGLDLSFDDLAPGRHATDERMYELFGVSGQASRLNAVMIEVRKNWCHLQTLFPGVRELLQENREKGLYIALISNRTDLQMFDDPAVADLLPLVDLAVTAETAGVSKPHPAPLRYFLEKAGVQPEEALFVGDTQSDAQTAQAAGVPFAFAQWDVGELEMNADYWLKDIAALRELINELM